MFVDPVLHERETPRLPRYERYHHTRITHARHTRATKLLLFVTYRTHLCGPLCAPPPAFRRDLSARDGSAFPSIVKYRTLSRDAFREGTVNERLTGPHSFFRFGTRGSRVDMETRSVCVSPPFTLFSCHSTVRSAEPCAAC